MIALIWRGSRLRPGCTSDSPICRRPTLGKSSPRGQWWVSPRTLVDQSIDLPIDYVAVGPVYPTKTKETGYADVGLELITYAAGLRPARPVVGIGGITLEQAADVIAAGATSVAVISDLLVGNEPTERVAAYVEALGAPSK